MSIDKVSDDQWKLKEKIAVIVSIAITGGLIFGAIHFLYNQTPSLPTTIITPKPTYLILQCPAYDTKGMESDITSKINDGYSLYGNPIVSDGHIYQAIVLTPALNHKNPTQPSTAPTNTK